MTCTWNLISLILVASVATVLSSPAAKMRTKRQIFPGTKWCGAGDRASNYNDLGNSAATDACCRTHDHCEHQIDAGATAYGIKNSKLYTVSDCKCDEAFVECLRDAAKLSSFMVKELYTDIIEVPCVSIENGVGTWHEKSPVIRRISVLWPGDPVVPWKVLDIATSWLWDQFTRKRKDNA